MDIIAAKIHRTQAGIFHRVTLTDPLGQGVWSAEPGFRHTAEFLSERDAKAFQAAAYAQLGRARRRAAAATTTTTAALAA